jgi:ribosome-binding protein aMBF1 (putative translation factor)
VKSPIQVEDTSLFDEIVANTPQDIKIFVSRSLQLSHNISKEMERKNITAESLALRLGTTEAKISYWLSGSHNFDLKTISKIEAVLDAPII